MAANCNLDIISIAHLYFQIVESFCFKKQLLFKKYCKRKLYV